jgi:hypothetical protein
MHRLLARAALAALFACGHLSPAYAQRVPPVNIVGVSVLATHFLDSLAHESRVRRVETADCVVRYAVMHDTLLVSTVEGAAYVHGDSAHVYSYGPICPLGVPAVHTHLLPNIDPRPSAIDSASARVGGIWSLVLVVQDTSWRLLIYGGVPSPQ